jgi:hypothetical protein
MNTICETCLCIDTEENPIFEVLDEEGFVIEKICMMCYAESLEDDNGEYTT